MTPSDDILRELIAAVTANTRELRRQHEDRYLNADERWLGDLMPLLYRAHEPQWTAASIVAYADNKPWFSLIEPYLADTKALGVRLAACVDKRVGDFILERVGIRGGVMAYRIKGGQGDHPPNYYAGHAF